MKTEFFFDVISPYTYLGFVILSRYHKLWNLDLVFRPFYLGGIMSGSGNTPPALVPNRGQFMSEDLKRNVKWLGLEGKFLFMPTNFFSPQVNKVTIQLNRFLCLVVGDLQIPDNIKWKAVSECFKFFWEDPSNRNSENEFEPCSNVIEVICDRVGYPGLTKFIPHINTEGKQILIDNTNRALELNAFGSPILYFPEKDPVIFFGSDRFEQIAFLYNLKWYGPRGPSSKL